MDQNRGNSGDFGTGPGGSTGSGSTSSGSSFGTGGTGSGMNSGGGMSSGSGSSMGGGSMGNPSGGFGVTSASDTGSTGAASETCPHCGQSMNRGGLEQFLGRLGITDDMMENLKGQFQNVDIDEYLNTAREYLKDSSGKAQTYAKENPGRVAAGVAALALGAGLIYAAVNRDRT